MDRESYDPIMVDGQIVSPTKIMQELQPRVGRCYISNDQLADAVILWREGRPDLAKKYLEKIIDDKSTNAPLVTEATRLLLGIAQMSDWYSDIYFNAQALLNDDPTDVHALFVMALYYNAILQLRNRLGEEWLDEDMSLFGTDTGAARARALAEVSPYLSNVLQGVWNMAEGSWSGWLPMGNVALEAAKQREWPGGMAIAVVALGPLMKADGSFNWDGVIPMHERIDMGAALAKAFPKATVIATGSAVPNGQAEGDYIKEMLIGLDASLKDRVVVDNRARDELGNILFTADWLQTNAAGGTLLLVGNNWANPRLQVIANGTFSAMQLTPTVATIEAGNAYFRSKNLSSRIVTEQMNVFRDAVRSIGFFDSCDFEQGDLVRGPLLFVFGAAVVLCCGAVFAIFFVGDHTTLDPPREMMVEMSASSYVPPKV